MLKVNSTTAVKIIIYIYGTIIQGTNDTDTNWTAYKIADYVGDAAFDSNDYWTFSSDHNLSDEFNNVCYGETDKALPFYILHITCQL